MRRTLLAPHCDSIAAVSSASRRNIRATPICHMEIEHGMHDFLPPGALKVIPEDYPAGSA